MRRHWTVKSNSLELDAMPFYWRMTDDQQRPEGIPAKLPIRIEADAEFDYLRFRFNDAEWGAIDLAYQQDQTIGFINPDMGQMDTYGASVNRFVLDTLKKFSPDLVYEIGCGAGFTLKHLEKNGCRAIGIDPSAYSLRWSKHLNFELINDYFSPDMFDDKPDFIYCNDVFEHIPNVIDFSKQICQSLADGGVFCFCTTNSTGAIELGDISMLEHQHVNMFTRESIMKILVAAGFGSIEIAGGSYGNTFHVHAIKGGDFGGASNAKNVTDGFFERAEACLRSFGEFYNQHPELRCYVPLRCIPYLASVGDYGSTPLHDSNEKWSGKYIDGYDLPISNLRDASYTGGHTFFIGSMTFANEIRTSLIEKGYPRSSLVTIGDLCCES